MSARRYRYRIWLASGGADCRFEIESGSDEGVWYEIDVEIPDGYEPTGEYRAPKTGEMYLRFRNRSVDVAQWDWQEPRLILREKPLTYEDFERVEVRSTNGTVELQAWVWLEGGRVCWSAGRTRQPDKAREVAAALIAAADHVDRVNAQKERS